MREQIVSYIGMGILLALVVRWPDVLAQGLTTVSVKGSDIFGGTLQGILQAGRH